MDGIWIVGYRDFGFEVADAAEDAGYRIAGYVEYDANENQTERRESRVLLIDEIRPGLIDRFLCACTADRRLFGTGRHHRLRDSPTRGWQPRFRERARTRFRGQFTDHRDRTGSVRRQRGRDCGRNDAEHADMGTRRRWNAG